MLPPTHAPGRFHRFFANLGPGLITGAADDDPSGISTYSVAGAAFGYGMLWTALLTFPLMASIQLMCARLGMVTGRGLAGVVRRRYPRWVLWVACGLLVTANVVNIGADLGGMAEAAELITGIPSWFWTPFFAVLIVSLLFWSNYRTIVRIFKWLTLVLFCYVAAAFVSRPDWPATLRGTFLPHVEWSGAFLATLIAVLGTTISPYLFFWQASNEVEDERALGRITVEQRQGSTEEELRTVFVDVTTGMFFSIFIMYFITLTTAATLHAHGQTSISTTRQAAEALRPLAGQGAYLLFTIGLVGAGMLGVPVLAGSCAYAISEAADWEGSLEQKPWLAIGFYAVMAVSMALGLALDYLGFSAVSMLFWSAVLNGVLAPPLLVLVVLLTSDSTVMGTRVNPRPLACLGWACVAIMTTATVGFFLSAKF